MNKPVNKSVKVSPKAPNHTHHKHVSVKHQLKKK